MKVGSARAPRWRARAPSRAPRGAPSRPRRAPPLQRPPRRYTGPPAPQRQGPRRRRPPQTDPWVDGLTGGVEAPTGKASGREDPPEVPQGARAHRLRAAKGELPAAQIEALDARTGRPLGRERIGEVRRPRDRGAEVADSPQPTHRVPHKVGRRDPGLETGHSAQSPADDDRPGVVIAQIHDRGPARLARVDLPQGQSAPLRQARDKLRVDLPVELGVEDRPIRPRVRGAAKIGRRRGEDLRHGSHGYTPSRGSRLDSRYTIIPTSATASFNAHATIRQNRSNRYTQVSTHAHQPPGRCCSSSSSMMSSLIFMSAPAFLEAKARATGSASALANKEHVLPRIYGITWATTSVRPLLEHGEEQCDQAGDDDEGDDDGYEPRETLTKGQESRCVPSSP